MIDLDVLDSSEAQDTPFAILLNQYEENHRLYIGLAKRLVLGQITYVDFQRLSKWLGCYYYVIPSQRDILPELSDFIYSRMRYNLFGLALLVGHLQANLSQEMQQLLLKELQRE